MFGRLDPGLVSDWLPLFPRLRDGVNRLRDLAHHPSLPVHAPVAHPLSSGPPRISHRPPMMLPPSLPPSVPSTGLSPVPLPDPLSVLPPDSSPIPPVRHRFRFPVIVRFRRPIPRHRTAIPVLRRRSAIPARRPGKRKVRGFRPWRSLPRHPVRQRRSPPVPRTGKPMDRNRRRTRTRRSQGPSRRSMDRAAAFLSVSIPPWHAPPVPFS